MTVTQKTLTSAVAGGTSAAVGFDVRLCHHNACI